MKELLPYKSHKPVSFSLSVQECLDRGNLNISLEELAFAQIHSTGSVSCISKGSSIEIVHNKSGARRAAYDFNDGCSKKTILCVCPYGEYFLVGLKCHGSATPGLLCVYDPGTSRVKKAINLLYVPSSLNLIKRYGGAGYGPTLFNAALKCMFGVVAVGTENGHVYLIDMRNDDINEEFLTDQSISLLILDPSDLENIAASRDKARNTRAHCCIDLSYSLCSANAFNYIGVDGKVIKVCSTNNCCVTSITYLPEACLLVVGFSFGTFQIWSLEHLQLVYSSPLGSYISPVTHVLFQEPDDDPRQCCYLWIGRGPSYTQTQVGPTTLTLYQMLFEFKENTHKRLPAYRNLECVVPRFDHQLTADVHHLVDSRTIGSRIITLRVLDRPVPHKMLTGDTNEAKVNDTTMCYVVWETPPNQSDSSMSCHLGIFDINRWYQKQMPRSIRDAMYGRMEAVCPFFAFYTLTDVAEAFLPNGILDAYIDLNSLNTFRNVDGPQSEQFYWPSASSFKVHCISESSYVETDILGVQRQIIADMRTMGTDSFLEAQDLTKSCWVAGLLQNSLDVTKLRGEKRNADALLNISLEHNGVAFITSCIKKWSHGSITHAGHSLKLIYDWAWNQVVTYKKAFDQLHIPIFCSATDLLETEQMKKLNRLTLELTHLSNIFAALKRSNALTEDSGIQELSIRANIATYLSLYGEVLLLLLHSGLLPAQPGIYEKGRIDKVKYPCKLLTEYYDNQRKKLSEAVSDRNGGDPILFIDSMWQELNRLKDVDNASDNADCTDYPPVSIEVMCRLFLQKLFNDNTKLNVLYYWVLDLCESFEELKQMKINLKFKECLKMKKDKSLLIEAVWLLDHELYKAAAEHIALVDFKVPSTLYHEIVRKLFNRNELDLLTLFCSTKEPDAVCSIEETKYLIKILLELKMLPNAYKMQHSFSQSSKKNEMFFYFLEQCKENKTLSKLITLPLTLKEEEVLRFYLESSIEHGDYLLVYYLERGMTTEASQLTNKIKYMSQVDFDRMSQENTVSKCLLVDGFLQVVPNIQKRKLSLSKEQKYNEKPLSTIVRNQKQHSSFLRSSLNSINDVNEFCRSKNFFGDSFTSNSRRRKSPLFDGEVVSPTKKTKENTDICFTSPLKDANQTILEKQRRSGLFSGSDAYLLLQTPPISRATKLTNGVREATKTPQSILKSRITSKVNQLDEQTTSHRGHSVKIQLPNVNSPGRKIRFAGVASPTSPETLFSSSPEYASSPEHSYPTPATNTTNLKGDVSSTPDMLTPDISTESNDDSAVYQSPMGDFDTDMNGSFQETLGKSVKLTEKRKVSYEVEEFLNEEERTQSSNETSVDEILKELNSDSDIDIDNVQPGMPLKEADSDFDTEVIDTMVPKDNCSVSSGSANENMKMEIENEKVTEDFAPKSPNEFLHEDDSSSTESGSGESSAQKMPVVEISDSDASDEDDVLANSEPMDMEVAEVLSDDEDEYDSEDNDEDIDEDLHSKDDYEDVLSGNEEKEISDNGSMVANEQFRTEVEEVLLANSNNDKKKEDKFTANKIGKQTKDDGGQTTQLSSVLSSDIEQEEPDLVQERKSKEPAVLQLNIDLPENKPSSDKINSFTQDSESVLTLDSEVDLNYHLIDCNLEETNESPLAVFVGENDVQHSTSVEKQTVKKHLHGSPTAFLSDKESIDQPLPDFAGKIEAVNSLEYLVKPPTDDMPPLFDSTLNDENSFIFASSMLHDAVNSTSYADASTIFSNNLADNSLDISTVERSPQGNQVLPSRRITRSAARRLAKSKEGSDNSGNNVDCNETGLDESATEASVQSVDVSSTVPRRGRGRPKSGSNEQLKTPSTRKTRDKKTEDRSALQTSVLEITALKDNQTNSFTKPPRNKFQKDINHDIDSSSLNSTAKTPTQTRTRRGLKVPNKTVTSIPMEVDGAAKERLAFESEGCIAESKKSKEQVISNTPSRRTRQQDQYNTIDSLASESNPSFSESILFRVPSLSDDEQSCELTKIRSVAEKIEDVHSDDDHDEEEVNRSIVTRSATRSSRQKALELQKRKAMQNSSLIDAIKVNAIKVNATGKSQQSLSSCSTNTSLPAIEASPSKPKTQSDRRRKGKTNESLLSFDKTDVLDEDHLSVGRSGSTRAASRRASLAITENLNLTRRSLRSSSKQNLPS